MIILEKGAQKWKKEHWAEENSKISPFRLVRAGRSAQQECIGIALGVYWECTGGVGSVLEQRRDLTVPTQASPAWSRPVEVSSLQRAGQSGQLMCIEIMNNSTQKSVGTTWAA